MVTASSVRRAAAPRRTARQGSDRGPVFVIGAPYSGATLLAHSLGLHPRIDPLRGGAPLDAFLSALDILEAGGLDLIDGAVFGLLRALGEADESNESVLGPPHLRAMARVAGTGGRTRTRRCVIGAPGLSLHVYLLSRLFPNARFLHVLRDVESVIWAATQQSSANTAEQTGASWLVAVQACTLAERALGSDVVLRVHYADLVSDSESELTRMLQFVREPFASECIWPFRLAGQSAQRVSGPVAGAPSGAVELSAQLLRRKPPRQQSLRALARLQRQTRELRRDVHASDPEVGAIKRLVAAVVPHGETLLVVSKGHEDLVRLDGHYGWHFPRTREGQYAGFHPAGSSEVIAHLHEFEQQGVRYLLFPASAYWWLDYYHGLCEYLQRSARVVIDTQWCKIFQLTDAAPVQRTRTSDARRSVLVCEPDNRQAFEIIRPTPPRRDRQRLRGDLWAVTAYYNPARYHNKSENYRRFRAGLAAAGVPLLTVEAVFEDGEFELSSADADLLVQVRGASVLWQKERLLHIGIERLPERCDKVAWLDGDVLFQRPGWSAEATRLLNNYQVVQLFSHCVRLPRGASECDATFLPFGPGENQLFHGVAFGVAARGRESLEDFFQSGHTGFAWSARRSLLERVGLYDANPLGNGDMDIAQAMWGNRRYFAWENRNEASKPHLELWARQFAEVVDGSVGCVSGLLYHLWHGDRQNRIYDDRLRVLRGFNPERDLEIDRATGLYRWKDASAELRDWARGYFELRKEE